jgi:hypothetical protein
MMQNGSEPRKRFHVVIGTPDEDNCPICRAHGKAPTDQVIPSEFFGPILVQELHLNEMLRCPCPLCAQARSRSQGD